MISEIPGKTFSKIVSFVDQKIVLLNATISENLSLWNSGVSFEQITNASKIASIHDWIINRPEGYQHKLSEDGSNVSGGEKARLEIARALANEPALIILDEATSALDPATEQSVIKAIRRIAQEALLSVTEWNQSSYVTKLLFLIKERLFNGVVIVN